MHAYGYGPLFIKSLAAILRIQSANNGAQSSVLAIGHCTCVGGSTTPILMSYGHEQTLKMSLMANFTVTWSASDRPVSSYNSGREAQIEAPQAPEGRAR